MMSVLTTEPTAWACQLSARFPDGKPALSVLAKRSYTVSDGVCFPEPEFPGLVEEPLFDELDLLLEADTDLFPLKPLTDVTVKGFAYNFGARSPQWADAGLYIGNYGKTLRLWGDRQATLSSSGAILFSEPQPISRIPLSYAFAYGGRDVVAEARHGFPWEGVFKDFVTPGEGTPETTSPFRYPRNPAGCGYVLTADRESLESLRLPNIEDPADPLTPDRLAVGNPEDWPRQPLPAGMGWISYEWFPRSACFGIVPPFDESHLPLSEVTRGFLSEEIVSPTTWTASKAHRFTCGASLGLQFALLSGGETIRLLNLSEAGPEVWWNLPQPPRILTDGRNGRLNPTKSVLHTVVLEPDQDRLTVLWRGAAPALRPYGAEELQRMPFLVEWSD